MDIGLRKGRYFMTAEELHPVDAYRDAEESLRVATPPGW
jgi:hypothetical protein